MAIAALRRAFTCRRRGATPAGYARDEEGGTALEFALAAPMFFAVLLSIFEVAVIFGTNVMLEAAANRAAREVRVGEIYISTINMSEDPIINPDTLEVEDPNPRETERKSMFYDAFCEGLILIPCEEITYDVSSYSSFGTANTTLTCDGNGDLDTPNFDIGGPADIVVVTLNYPYDWIIPNPLHYSGRDWKTVAEGGCNGLTLRAVKVFVNEPFPRSGVLGGG